MKKGSSGSTQMVKKYGHTRSVNMGTNKGGMGAAGVSQDPKRSGPKVRQSKGSGVPMKFKGI